MGYKVGIDFGTSNSGMALFDGEKVRLLPLDPFCPLPEVVKTILYITRDDQHYIGQEAVRLYYEQNINRLRRFVKKWAGEIDYRGADMHYVRDIFVFVDELKPGRLLQYLKTALRKGGGPNGYHGTQIFERYYRVEDLLQIYLETLKQRAESILGGPIEHVTLGRPVKFADSPENDQRAEETLRQAAYAAGFGEVAFELEPVAAALYYERSLAKPESVLVFDFGGGTLDIAIMRLGPGSQRKVFASGGIDVAGSDFDRAIIQKRMLAHFGEGLVSHQPDIVELIEAVPDWIALPDLSTPQNQYTLEHAIQQSMAPVRLKNLKSLIFNDLAFSFYNQVESAKILLSRQGAAVISLQEQGIDVWELYTRSQFEKDILHYQAQIEAVLQATLADSGLAPGDVDAVVTTGGSSNIPLFQETLARLFGRQKIKSSDTFSSVTAGLAIRAYEVA